MPSEKQIEAAADQISEGLGAFLRKFCDSEASKRARYYLHEMPKDEWNQMALMLATEALTAAEQAETATDAEPVAWLIRAPEDDYYGIGPVTLQFNPLEQWDLDKGYTQTPLYTRPPHGGVDVG